MKYHPKGWSWWSEAERVNYLQAVIGAVQKLSVQNQENKALSAKGLTSEAEKNHEKQWLMELVSLPNWVKQECFTRALTLKLPPNVEAYVDLMSKEALESYGSQYLEQFNQVIYISEEASVGQLNSLDQISNQPKSQEVGDSKEANKASWEERIKIKKTSSEPDSNNPMAHLSAVAKAALGLQSRLGPMQKPVNNEAANVSLLAQVLGNGGLLKEVQRFTDAKRTLDQQIEEKQRLKAEQELLKYNQALNKEVLLVNEQLKQIKTDDEQMQKLLGVKPLDSVSVKGLENQATDNERIKISEDLNTASTQLNLTIHEAPINGGGGIGQEKSQTQEQWMHHLKSQQLSARNKTPAIKGSVKTDTENQTKKQLKGFDKLAVNKQIAVKGYDIIRLQNALKRLLTYGYMDLEKFCNENNIAFMHAKDEENKDEEKIENKQQN